jgi:hypothetical protein
MNQISMVQKLMSLLDWFYLTLVLTNARKLEVVDFIVLFNAVYSGDYDLLDDYL